MGQELSQPSLSLQRSVSSKHTHNLSGSKVKKISESKTIILISEGLEFSIEINDDTLTCGWLLSEAIRLLENKEVIALRTTKNLEALDCWLMHFERNLIPFKNNEVLTPVLHSNPGSSIGPKSFIPIKFIGRGGFSNVIEVRKKDSGDLFAVKIMKKQLLLNENKIQQIITEKNILKDSDSPFVVKLHWAYLTEDDLHLVMDFCPGGELFYHLHNLGRFTEEQARFYISEILLGIEYLHSKDIVYRDLKPENILLDLDGHIKITDFGLSKEGISSSDQSSSFCGSPEYMSPEMLLGKGHGRAVDFYSLGALLFEMLVGVPPFYSQNRSIMYNSILQSELNVPSFISKNGKDLILRLLDKNPETRLGVDFGTKEIRAHPWFKGTSWTKVTQRKQIPPYRPNFRHSNFDSEYLKVPLNNDIFNQDRILPDSAFFGFEYNVETEKEKGDSLYASTETSRHGNSLQAEEYNATKVKLFLPCVAPKITDEKNYYSKHRRTKDINVDSILSDVKVKTKNLVQELRPIASQRSAFRKEFKTVSQDFIDLDELEPKKLRK